MKKVLVAVLALSMVFSMSFSVFAGERPLKADNRAEKAVNKVKDGNALQKAFKMELNQQKKDIAKEKGALEAQKQDLMAQYDALVATDAAGAAALLTQIEGLNAQILILQNEMKEIINQRYMVIKTLYTAEELAQFATAADLVAQMYADAATLGMGSIIVKDNIIKLDSPAYIKGGRTIIPVRAITEELGATVAYDPAAQTVTVAKDGITIVFQISSRTVTVNGVAQELDAASEITNGRTYVPLRFIAETFGLAVTFEPDTDTVDIDEPAAVETPDVTEEPESTEAPEVPETTETPAADETV